MINGLLLKKGQMTQIYNDQGRFVAGTFCLLPRTHVLENLSQGKIKLAIGQKRKASKALLGVLKKAKLKTIPHRIMEFSLLDKEKFPAPGEELKIDQIFSLGDKITVTGISKGRGFAGAIKRWGFHSQPKTHGQSDRERATGSIGAQTPGKVVKGKKMPGHAGNRQITVKSLKILQIDPEKSSILVSGAVPGHIKSWLIIKKAPLKKAKK